MVLELTEDASVVSLAYHLALRRPSVETVGFWNTKSPVARVTTSTPVMDHWGEVTVGIREQDAKSGNSLCAWATGDRLEPKAQP